MNPDTEPFQRCQLCGCPSEGHPTDEDGNHKSTLACCDALKKANDSLDRVVMRLARINAQQHREIIRLKKQASKLRCTTLNT